eukprot:9471183-Pyramimonas_sp.AAC.2
MAGPPAPPPPAGGAVIRSSSARWTGSSATASSPSDPGEPLDGRQSSIGRFMRSMYGAFPTSRTRSREDAGASETPVPSLPSDGGSGQ